MGRSESCVALVCIAAGLTCFSPVYVQVDVLADFLGIGALEMSFKLLAMTSDQQKSILADCRQHLLDLHTC